MAESKKPDVSYAKPRLATLALYLFAAFLLGAAISMAASYHSAKQAQADLAVLAKTVQTVNESPRHRHQASIPEGIKTTFLFPAALAAGMFLLGVMASKGWRGAVLAALAAAILHQAVSYALFSNINWSGAAEFACFLLTIALCSRLARGSAIVIHVLCISAGWILFSSLWPMLRLTAILNLHAKFKTFIFAAPPFADMLNLLAAMAPFAIAWMIATRPAPAKKAA